MKKNGSSLLSEIRAREISISRAKCSTCADSKVSESIAKVLAEAERASELPQLAAFFAWLRERHPRWKATSVSTLRNHLVRHEPIWVKLSQGGSN
jgi:hypothetical protein